MEAVPRLPMINFDLKVSPDRPQTEFSKLKQYIRDFYNEDPESYATEIRNLESLRATAVRPVKDVAGCLVLKKYFCQLHFLQSRFPMAREGSAAVEFTWKDIYSGSTMTAADVKIEMVSILYNIGALHSQLGASEDRSAPDGLKMACTHFQCAAWAFQHLKDTFPQPPGTDLSPDIMHFKYHFCLAQAQECILEKSMTDNRKATINAKVAAQIVDYYNLALNTLVQPPSDILSDGAVLDVVGNKPFKTWKKYIRFKVAYYSCISLLYQGMQSEEQRKMGERVTYYQGALDRLNEAIKLSKGIDKSEAVMESLVFTRDVVEGKRKAAKNENEFIYHEEIPELDSLPHVKGASLVKGTPFSVNDTDISGPDIFARLVPMKAHEASSMYSEEKAKLLRKISALIDAKDEEVVSFMSCLQLDYLKAHLDSPILPQEVIDRCASLSDKPDAIPNLVAAMDKLTDAYHDVDGMLKEIMELIKIEENAEKEYQEIMGPRPPSIVATDLTREANKYMEVHKKAADSNETLHRAMTQHIENLRALQQPLSEIEATLPNLTSLNLMDDPTLNEVILLVNKVGEMRRQRATLASQLRESICSDDITGQLVTRINEKMEDIFVKELEKHDKYVTLIEQNLAAQDNILRALTEAYANYAPTRKATTEIMRQRDMMLSALISSYDAYEDLLAKSSKGQEFYRKLETNLTKLLQRVKGTCKVQQEERDSILALNMKKAQQIVESGVASLHSPSSGGGLKLKDYLQNKKTAASSAGSSSAPGSPYYNNSANNDGNPSWLPGVRPAPVGSEGIPSVSVCMGSTKQPDSIPHSTSVFNSQQPTLHSYTPQTSSYNTSHASAASKYPDAQAYYYHALYSQNPALSTLQYPTMSDATGPEQYDPSYSKAPYNYNSTKNNAGSMAYSHDHSYAKSTGNADIPEQQFSSLSLNPPGGQISSANQAASTYNNYNQQNPSYGYPAQPQAVGNSYSTATDHTSQGSSNLQNYNTYYSMSGQTNISTSTYVPDYNTYTGYDGYYGNQSSGGYGSWPQQSPQVGQQQSHQGGQQQVDTSVTHTSQGQLTVANQPSAAQQPAPQPQTPSNGNVGPQWSNQTSIPSNIAPNSSTMNWPQNVPGTAWQTETASSYSSTPATDWQQQTKSASNVPTQNWQPQVPTTNSATATWSQTPASGAATTWQTQPQTNSGVVPSWQQSSTGVPNSSVPGWPKPDTPSTYGASYDNQKPVGTQQNPQYYGQPYQTSFDYSNVYPTPQFQNTPGTQTSHYSNAKSTELTNPTMSPVGNTPYPSAYTPAYTSSDYTHNYYVHPYGQYTTPSGTPSFEPTDQAQLSKLNTVTYMVASNGVNSSATTYTQQQIEPVKPASNVDLLAGLDFAISDAPLLPQPRSGQSTEESREKLSNLVQPDSTTPKPQESESDKILVPTRVNDVERPSPSKTPVKDPFTDQDLLEQFVQEVEKFEKFVVGLNSKTLNGPTTLDLKWNELQDLQEKDAHKLIISVARCYPMKNRFADILPYDLTRVELPSTKDDYINASYVKDLGPGCPNFIITQAPLKSTFADFWTMVLEQHVELIVCLLAESQMGNEVYWAMNKGNDMILGKTKVSLQSCTVRNHWVERIFTVSDGKASKVVMHLEFTSWPNSWLPESPKPLLSLVEEMFNVWSQQRGRGPVVVHCDAGVGRSGVFVVTTQCLAELKLLAHLPEVISLTAKLAKCRKNPLRDRQFLQFTYQCLLYYAQDLLMKRGILTSRSSFEEKRSKTKSHTRHPSEDFLLNSLKDPTERRTSDASSTSSSSKPADADPLSQIDALWPIKRYS
uniref:Tyrosine-protein phosphatase non-receptor type 23 n=1 Tax=Lygus hesperus TaxID=30085 RepID=A0A146M9J2_LYGHE